MSNKLLQTARLYAKHYADTNNCLLLKVLGCNTSDMRSWHTDQSVKNEYIIIVCLEEMYDCTHLCDRDGSYI